jgi:hypothetical protein
MKKHQIPILVLFVFGSFILLNCSKDRNQETTTVIAKNLNIDSVSFNHSMKGWELYSWPNGNEWKFSILTGTNRSKSYEEVTGNEIIVSGNDTLKLLLDKFPEGEEIFWIGEEWLERIWNGDHLDLTLPDNNTINEIKNYCDQKKLVLSITS